MTDREIILNSIEHFFVDIFEFQKELDMKIYAESSPRNIFKKKDYRANINEYKRLKDIALEIDTSEFAPDENDDELIELVCIFDETLALYNLYTDRGINVQEYLRRKADGEKYKASEYTEATSKQKSVAKVFTRSINELSAAYANYKDEITYEG